MPTIPQEDTLSPEEMVAVGGVEVMVCWCAVGAVLEAGRGGRQQLVCREQRLRLASYELLSPILHLPGTGVVI